MRLRNFLKPLSFIPAILIMYMIFSFSAQPGEVSSAVSYKVSHKIVETADHIFDVGLEDWQIDNWAVRINGVTRKLAHMTEYFLLAIAVSFPLYVYGLRGLALVLVAGLFCVAFAAGDEYHQSMGGGRSPQVKDVGIDSAGVLIGIILVRIIGWTGRMTLFRPVPQPAEVEAKIDYKKARSEERARKQALKAAKRHAAKAKAQEKNSRHSGQQTRYVPADEDSEYNTFDASEDYFGAQSREAAKHVSGSHPSSDTFNKQYADSIGEGYDADDYDDNYDDRYAGRYDDRYDNRFDTHYTAPTPDDESSDELSDDMPFSKFFHK